VKTRVSPQGFLTRREIGKDNVTIIAFPRHRQRRAKKGPCRGRGSRQPDRRWSAKARGEAGRQRLRADAQRHRLYRGCLCGDAARRLYGAGELAFHSRIAGAPDFSYHNKPEKRAEIERDGFITSGDVGYIDADGYVFLCDRKRDMVISGGVNIYPAEIESALHGLPGVHDCAVFGIPDEEFGEALMAVVEPLPGVTLDIAAIRAQLKTRLADYKVPKHVEIATDLPREDSGKIFKRRLRDPHWEKAGRTI
jgi:hypothetical protein